MIRLTQRLSSTAIAAFAVPSVLILLFGILPACRTAPGAGSFLTPERVGAIAKVATYSGSVLDLRAHPEHRVAWAQAERGLADLIAQERWDVTAAAAVLSTAPVKFLQTPEGGVTITGAIALSDAFGLGRFDAARNEHARALIIGIHGGLELGLRVTASVRGRDDPFITLLRLESEAAATRTR